jgi:hypothetical protein
VLLPNCLFSSGLPTKTLYFLYVPHASPIYHYSWFYSAGSI